MRQALIFFLASCSLSAQVALRFTPEPMAVPTAQIANAHTLGRWVVMACNNGSSPVSLPWERIAMAGGEIPFVDPDDAMTVLTANQSRSIPGIILKAGAVTSEAIAIALLIASKANLPLAGAISIGGTIAPQLVTVAKGELPSLTPLISTVKYPVVLQPGDCTRDHWFSAKMKSPRIVDAELLVPGSLKPAAVPAPTAAPVIPPAVTQPKASNGLVHGYRVDYDTSQLLR